jgi:hypothetical protein
MIRTRTLKTLNWGRGLPYVVDTAAKAVRVRNDYLRRARATGAAWAVTSARKYNHLLIKFRKGARS